MIATQNRAPGFSLYDVTFSRLKANPNRYTADGRRHVARSRLFAFAAILAAAAASILFRVAGVRG
jgi:hypothetical protein